MQNKQIIETNTGNLTSKMWRWTNISNKTLCFLLFAIINQKKNDNNKIDKLINWFKKKKNYVYLSKVGGRDIEEGIYWFSFFFLSLFI
jgi:hypothetical protein